MLQRLIVISILLQSAPWCHGFIKQSEIKKEILKEMDANKPYVDSNVNSYEKEKEDFQSLKLKGAAYHVDSCKKVFGTLGQYENYKKMISFIKESHYNEKNKRVFFLLSHFLLPFDMVMDFKIPRIKDEGMYTFKFDQGFLKSLIGEIFVQNLNEEKYKCFISIDIKWSGPDSPFPDFIFQYFSKVLLNRSIKKLWSESNHHF